MALCSLLGLMLAGLLLVGKTSAQLAPDIQADRYLVEAERHIGTGDYAAAKAALDRILGLQAAHDLTLPEAFWFKHAQVAYQAGSYADAVESVTRYLTTAGREGTHYREALELLDRAETEPERRAAEQRGADGRRCVETVWEQMRRKCEDLAETDRLFDSSGFLGDTIGEEVLVECQAWSDLGEWPTWRRVTAAALESVDQCTSQAWDTREDGQEKCMRRALAETTTEFEYDAYLDSRCYPELNSLITEHRRRCCGQLPP